MARTLKVFQAQFGFYDTVVAAPSQAAALRAWGAHQNLFRDGQARDASDQQAIDAARSEPGVPLRRAIGSDEPFSLNPGLPTLPDSPARKPRRSKAGANGAASMHPASPPSSKAPPRPSPPDRSALAAAEAAVKALATGRAREETIFRRRREELAAEEGAASKRYDEARARAQAVVKRKKSAFDAERRQYEQTR